MFRRKKELYIIEVPSSMSEANQKKLDEESKKVEKECNAKLFFINTGVTIKPVNKEAKNGRDKSD